MGKLVKVKDSVYRVTAKNVVYSDFFRFWMSVYKLRFWHHSHSNPVNILGERQLKGRI